MGHALLTFTRFYSRSNKYKTMFKYDIALKLYI
jgi:hypothetical protein